MSRLVMIHGACWGVGQSTLCRRLAAVIPDVDVLWEDELSQPSIFTRPEFAAVADRFRRHNAQPQAGIGSPTASMLEDAYERLVLTVRAHGRTALMGWSIMDLAEDLDWAMADEHALQRHSRTVRDILAPLDPVLILLDGDIATALTRATIQRGRAWFNRGRPIDDSEWHSERQRLINEASTNADRVTSAFDAGRWFPALRVDGSVLDAEEVFRAVARYLRRRGLVIAP